MMDDMVERVARALAAADGMHPEAVSNDEDQVPGWTLYVDDARAAIEAMREPTDAMTDAIWEETADPCWRENAIKAWQAGVDVALKRP